MADTSTLPEMRKNLEGRFSEAYSRVQIITKLSVVSMIQSCCYYYCTKVSTPARLLNWLRPGELRMYIHNTRQAAFKRDLLAIF